ncbi:hypothetical protein NDU88_006500 [Pleurodeles waltl]|uniref:Uncharacterized protein n=1 Tax=Pleurodeles waltl TaxID=8319 RepID=A0AAV7WXR8_PLEWA|nr:hypothetical protein NDU88_006500 [Pleurodeles waltl]
MLSCNVFNVCGSTENRQLCGPPIKANPLVVSPVNRLAGPEPPGLKLTLCERLSCAGAARGKLKKGEQQARGKDRSGEAEEMRAAKQSRNPSGEVAALRVAKQDKSRSGEVDVMRMAKQGRSRLGEKVLR